MDQVISQLYGIGACAIYVCIASAICWAVIKATVGLRVKEDEEVEGLDYGEHGNEAYAGFQMSPVQH